MLQTIAVLVLMVSQAAPIELPPKGNLPVMNKKLSVEEATLCSSKQGRAILARRVPVEIRVREEEEVRKWEDLRERISRSVGARLAAQDGRAFPIPDPAPDLDSWHEGEEITSYCQVDGMSRYGYYVPKWITNSYERQISSGDSVIPGIIVFENLVQRRCSGDGGAIKAACSGEYTVELPAGYQVCNAHVQANRGASWLPGRVYYVSASPARTNPNDGVTPRAKGVSIQYDGHTTNNHPIDMSLDLFVNAVPIELNAEARFRRNCKLLKEHEDYSRQENPQPGRIMRNINH